MNNNILLKTSNAVFEPHIFNSIELPFIYHNSIIDKCDFVNFHEKLELLYFKNGSGYVNWDTKYYPIKQGDVVVVNSYATHQIITDGSIDRICLIIDNNFCKYHFLREFKKKTGFTLSNYINIIRCKYAKELLYSGKYTVKEVALLCSFDNFSYFTNVFKKHTGSLPSDYIKAKK